MKKIVSNTFRCKNCQAYTECRDSNNKAGICIKKGTFVFPCDQFCSGFEGLLLVRQVKQPVSLSHSKTPFCIVLQ